MKLKVEEETKADKREQIAQALMGIYEFVTMRNEEMYVYEDGVYVLGKAETLIKEFVQKHLGKDCTRYDMNEVIASIKAQTYVDWDFWDVTPLNYICVDNGIIDIEKKTLSDHNFNVPFLSKIPVRYYPDAKCPKIDKFLREITSSEEAVQTLYEFAGYCLYRAMPIHKAFMLVGEGNNGKSTFLELLKAFLGERNVSNISLQELCQNKFARVNLHGKLANIYADLESKSLYQTGYFKMLVGGDTVDAEKKFFQQRTKFKNYAKLIFSCNKIPLNENDDTEAFWRRWVILVFPNKFEGKKADKNLLEKLTTLEELSGFLNKALEGLERLLKNGHFTINPKTIKIRENWIMATDSVKYFRDNWIIEEPTGIERKDVVYQKFIEFCIENNLPTIDKIAFTRRFKQLVKVEKCYKTFEGQRYWCYRGIKLVRLENQKTLEGKTLEDD